MRVYNKRISHTTSRIVLVKHCTMLCYQACTVLYYNYLTYDNKSAKQYLSYSFLKARVGLEYCRTRSEGWQSGKCT